MVNSAISSTEWRCYLGICHNIDYTKRHEQLLIRSQTQGGGIGSHEIDLRRQHEPWGSAHRSATPSWAFPASSQSSTKDLSKKRCNGTVLIQQQLRSAAEADQRHPSTLRMESGKMKFSYAPCDLNELFQRIYRTERQLVESLELKHKPSRRALSWIQLSAPHQVIITSSTTRRSSQTADTSHSALQNGRRQRSGSRSKTRDAAFKEQQQAVFERFPQTRRFRPGRWSPACPSVGNHSGYEWRHQTVVWMGGKGTRFIITIPNHVTSEGLTTRKAD